MKKFYLFFLLSLLLWTQGRAQTATIGIATTADNDIGPTFINNGNPTFTFTRHIAIYKASEILAGGGVAGTIEKIRWYKNNNNGYTLNNGEYKIYIKPVSVNTLATANVNWATEVTGATLVYSSTTQNLNTAAGWQEFNLTNPYTWNGTDNLEIFVDWHRPSPASGNVPWRYSVANNATSIAGGTTAPATVTRGNSRPNIQLAFAAAPTGPNDVGITAISGVASGCGLSAQQTIAVTIKNFGSAAQSNIPVSFTVNGNPAGAPETFAGPLAPGATANYTFTATANLAAPNTYIIVAQTNLTNDGTTTNDSFSKTITATAGITAFPYFEDFENGNGGWTAAGPNSSWALGTPAKPVINSAASGTKSWATNLSGTYNYDEDSRVVSPCMNFSTLTAPIVEMKIWWSSEEDYDGAVMQSSIDGGATWQKVGAFNDPNNWYNNTAVDAGPGGQPAATADGWSGTGTESSGGWVTAKHTLTGLGGQASVLLRIAFAADDILNYDGFAFDDITVYDTPSIDVGVTAVSGPATGCSLSTQEQICITVKNFGIAAQSNIPVSYTINGGTPVSETLPGPIAPNGTATYCFTTKANLSVSGTYAIVAQTALTGDGFPSNNASTKTVTAIPSVSTFPYFENFENGAGGWTSGGTKSSWALGTPAKSTINGAASGTKAWVTSLTGDYTPDENSYVLGPCFNFSTLTGDPDIEMKIWWDSEEDYDGAVLQSSINGGATWQKVGNFNDPTNWYNNDDIASMPGGQAIGWSGTGSGWVKAKHKLTGLAGQASVLLRIAFSGDDIFEYNGFAFDDVNIGDNTNNLVINSFVPLLQVCGFGNNENVEVVLENLGSTPICNFPVSYTVDNGTPVVATFTGCIAGGATANFSFPTGANLSASGNHVIVVTANNTNDPAMANNTISYTATNASFAGLPPTFNFETPTTGISALRIITATKASVVENAAGSNGTGSTKGLIMAGVTDGNWQLPVGSTDPWTANPSHLAGAYICFSPAGLGTNDQLFLTFDLKQVFKLANANTNFRVTVNGLQEGATYRPPFGGTPTSWQTVTVDLTAYKNLSNIQIGLESSVSEEYANGTGPANLVDNIAITTLLSAKNDLLQNQVQVYPNPSVGIFKVQLPASGKTYNLELTDLSGKTLKTQTSTNKVTELNLNALAKGIYLLKIGSEGSMAVKKLILE